MHVTRIDHVSFTVADLDRSAAFYRQLGFADGRRFSSAGPEVDAATDTEAAAMEIQLLHHPVGGPALELIRYLHHPAGRAAHNSRVGAAHVALGVTNMHEAWRTLRAAGIETISEPQVDRAGMHWVYVRDPDGNVVELVQAPDAAPNGDR